MRRRAIHRPITGWLVFAVVAPACAPDSPAIQSSSMIDAGANLARPDAPVVADAQSCRQLPSSLVIDPPSSALVPAGQSTSFSVAFTNHNSTSCEPLHVSFSASAPRPGITVEPTPDKPIVRDLVSGDVARFMLTATSDASVEPGPYFIPVSVGTDDYQGASGYAELQVDEHCPVRAERELVITDLSVVEDPVRTDNSGAHDDPRTGAWTFKRLVENMASTPADAPAMVEEVMQTFLVPQTLNGFTIDPRPAVQTLFLSNWPRTSSGELDLDRAPFRLLAIVNRFDQRNLANGDAGETRFVFGWVDAEFDSALFGTMIFEYKMPAASADDIVGWAQAFHALGGLPFSESYNTALQAITERVVRRNARPERVNGSGISAVRTHESLLNEVPWQMRTFALTPDSGRLVPALVEQTPDRSFNGSDVLARFILANQAAILDGTALIPELFEGRAFRAGVALRDTQAWLAPGVDSDTRHAFAMLTCNGCHGVEETGAGFQIDVRERGWESYLSPFFTSSWPDPVTFVERPFSELARRKADFKTVVCADAAAARRSAGVRSAALRAH